MGGERPPACHMAGPLSLRGAVPAPLSKARLPPPPPRGSCQRGGGLSGVPVQPNLSPTKESGGLVQPKLSGENFLAGCVTHGVLR